MSEAGSGSAAVRLGGPMGSRPACLTPHGLFNALGPSVLLYPPRPSLPSPLQHIRRPRPRSTVAMGRRKIEIQPITVRENGVMGRGWPSPSLAAVPPLALSSGMLQADGRRVRRTERAEPVCNVFEGGLLSYFYPRMAWHRLG